MKNIFFVFLLLTLGLSCYSQKKEISAARSYIKSGKNLNKAEELMWKLLSDSVNHGNEKIWLTLYESIYKQYEIENEKLYLKLKYDTIALFMQTKKMFSVLESLDSIDALPDRNGKVVFSFRKKHAEVLNQFRPNLYSGGIYFLRKQQYDIAFLFFNEYIDCATKPLFALYHYLDNDKMISKAAYWSVYCGYKLNDPKITLHHSYLALKDTSNYCLILQYLSETYLMENDSVRYYQIISEGFQKYPTFPYFFPRLVDYYSKRNLFDKALRVCEQALAIDSLNMNFLFAKSTILLNSSHYDKCLKVCDQLIAINDSFPDAYLNAGLAYYNQAVEIEKNFSIARKQHTKVIQLYKYALSYLKKYKELAPDQKKKWALPLYTIYLNLNMGKEFDAINQILREMKN